MAGLPWWVTWIVLPLLALFVIGWLVALVVRAVLYLVLIALVIGGVWYGYRRVRDAVTDSSRSS